MDFYPKMLLLRKNADVIFLSVGNANNADDAKNHSLTGTLIKMRLAFSQMRLTYFEKQVTLPSTASRI